MRPLRKDYLINAYYPFYQICDQSSSKLFALKPTRYYITVGYKSYGIYKISGVVIFLYRSSNRLKKLSFSRKS